MPTVDEPGSAPTGSLTRGRAALLIPAFLLATVVTRVAIECLGGGAALVWVLALHPTADPATTLDALPIGLVATMTIIQLAAMGALAVGFARMSGASGRLLSPTRGTPLVWAIAAIGGLLVGLGPGWFSDVLTRTLPDWMQLGALDQIARWFSQGSTGGRLLLGIAVVVFAPICEELVFRGTLWGLMRRVAPGWVTWLATSALFAAYHLDPVHVITVFPIGLFTGWVRWRSGSLGPAVLVHFLNNLSAAVLAVASTPEASIPAWIGLPAFAGTVLVALPAAFVRPDPVED